jgi:hypothetical protein
MNLIFTIFSILSSTSNKPKFCVNCIHFKSYFLANEFGKCALFPVIYDNNNYLVDGRSKNPKVDYAYCSVVRSYDNKCGENGNMYEDKKTKK